MDLSYQMYFMPVSARLNQLLPWKPSEVLVGCFLILFQQWMIKVSGEKADYVVQTEQSIFMLIFIFIKL